jgi:hypothetical protein
MNNLSINFDNMEQSQNDYNKQINKLLAEAKILLYEIAHIRKELLTNEQSNNNI